MLHVGWRGADADALEPSYGSNQSVPSIEQP